MVRCLLLVLSELLLEDPPTGLEGLMGELGEGGTTAVLGEKAGIDSSDPFIDVDVEFVDGGDFEVSGEDGASDGLLSEELSVVLGGDSCLGGVGGEPDDDCGDGEGELFGGCFGGEFVLSAGDGGGGESFSPSGGGGECFSPSGGGGECFSSCGGGGDVLGGSTFGDCLFDGGESSLGFDNLLLL
ncbi:uncharacterized protein LOC108451163 [Gossypium arboreum]|uniref:uncharacterized protein LOC108451163 n=1 Tax=Gossypium arboreum TaxID=29729 RepID=UPI000818F6CB|nr:uncharacterized protein LOC108451163 [Gossypium arboreum]